MALTPAQTATLKADITAKSQSGQPLETMFAASDWDGIADYYNTLSSPSFTTWKTLVPIGEIGKAFNNSELAGLSTANQTRLQTLAIYMASGVNPTLSSNRAFFDDIFSGAGGVTTRASLLALWKRFARRIEQLFATGTGLDASPASLNFEGVVNGRDILDTVRS